jgi:hypothetical protein
MCFGHLHVQLFVSLYVIKRKIVKNAWGKIWKKKFQQHLEVFFC